MKDPKQRLQQRTEEQTTSDSNQHVQGEPEKLRFSSVDELLRHDAERTEVPGAVTERLKASAQEVPSPRSWWQRFFGK